MMPARTRSSTPRSSGRSTTANKAVSKPESIRKFTVLAGDFTEDNGYLTPSLKLKRNIVMKDYAVDVEALYSGPSCAVEGDPRGDIIGPLAAARDGQPADRWLTYGVRVARVRR